MKNKIFAVIKHEYKKIVLKWSFLIGTFLLPLMGLFFSIVPALVLSIKGEPMKIVVVDPTGKIKPRLEKALIEEEKEEKSAKKSKKTGQSADLKSDAQHLSSNNVAVDRNVEEQGDGKMRDLLVGDFVLTDYSIEEKNLEQIQRELKAKVSDGEIDAYILIPENFTDENASFELYSRRAEDMITNSILRRALNNAVRAERLARAQINEEELQRLTKEINFSVKKIDEGGEEKEEATGFWYGFVVALLIYLVLSIYGQTILSVVVEEKETRIAEILFSSAKPFELMMGKLIGVGLAGLTQIAIWLISALVILLFSFPYLSAMGWRLPQISPWFAIAFLLYFLLGFFTYASIFALIGSMVTSVQEGGQFAFVPVMIMLISFYLCFAILRDPNSTVSFWISIAPFSSPLAMPIRIASEVPPLWQILVSIALNLLCIVGLIWIASRVYRVGMLMYGKRATIPEVWRWIREG